MLIAHDRRGRRPGDEGAGGGRKLVNPRCISSSEGRVPTLFGEDAGTQDGKAFCGHDDGARRVDQFSAESAGKRS